MNKIKKYLNEVFAECKKISFPSKREVQVYSIYIFFVVSIVALGIAFTDFLISHLIRIIFGMGI